jgi:hypothetical protein
MLSIRIVLLFATTMGFGLLCAGLLCVREDGEALDLSAQRANASSRSPSIPASINASPLRTER